MTIDRPENEATPFFAVAVCGPLRTPLAGLLNNPIEIGPLKVVSTFP